MTADILVLLQYIGTREWLPDTKERGEDRSVYLSEVVVAVVDRLQLVELGKRVPGDLHQLVERGVQELDPLLVLHRDLGKKGVDLKCFQESLFQIQPATCCSTGCG